MAFRGVFTTGLRSFSTRIAPILQSTPQLTSLSPTSKPLKDSKIQRSQYTTSFPPKKLVVAVTGATGIVLAVELLKQLRELGIETHLVLSKWAAVTLHYETDLKVSELRSLATFNYASKDLAAPISSGSFIHDGMVIVPCSMKTLAAVRMGYSEDLISRAADVSLKERRNLMMVVRETPLSDIHLENMLALRRSGAIIFPPVPAFYTKPVSIEAMVQQSVGRILDNLGIHTDQLQRWNGITTGR